MQKEAIISATDKRQAEQVQELLTVSEVAHELRVDTTTVRRWINVGALEAVALPHSGKRRGYRVKKQTMDTLLTIVPPATRDA